MLCRVEEGGEMQRLFLEEVPVNPTATCSMQHAAALGLGAVSSKQRRVGSLTSVFVPVGDLMFHVLNLGSFPETHVRFYVVSGSVWV